MARLPRVVAGSYKYGEGRTRFEWIWSKVSEVLLRTYQLFLRARSDLASLSAMRDRFDILALG